MDEIPLEEILTPVRNEVQLQDDATYVTAGILSYGRGLFERPAVRGSETSYKAYFRIHADQFVYSKLFAWEGALAVVPSTFDGYYVSQEFPTFGIDVTRALPGYLRLLCQWKPLWERLRAGETGMGGRRRRVHQKHLLATRVPLPSVAVQRRIIDLVEALDSAAARGAEVQRASERVLSSFLAEGRPASAEVPLGELASLGSGPSWSSAQESSEGVPGAAPVITIVNTRPDGRLDMSEHRWVAGLPSSVARLSESSLVMIRTNGNRSRIGNVYRVTRDAVGCAFSAFQIGIDVHDADGAEYVYWYLRSPDVQDQISQAASGTTGLGNVAVRWLRALPIPWPEESERAEFAATANAIDAVRRSSASALRALEDVRVAVLDDLLAGGHDIPNSYDKLLGQAS